MTAIQVLKNEHRAIERMLAVLEAAQSRLEDGLPVPPEIFVSAADFLGGFADRCHHAKEESELFPLLERRGVPVHGGPIGVMLAEHSIGREHVQALAAAAARYEAGHADAAQLLVDHSRSYSELLRQHIAKEDGVLFLIAKRVLINADTAGLDEAFARIDRHEIGERELARYHAMIPLLERAMGN